jgi:hypothetical protein
MIRTSHNAIPATDAARINVIHNAVVLVPCGGIDGTDERAGRVVG